MSHLRKVLKVILPKLASEANKLRDTEARSRWMKMKAITLSPKSLSKACAFYGWSMDAYSKWGQRLRKRPGAEALLSRSRKPYRSPNKTKPRKAKKVVQLRRQDPSQGPERISQDLKRIFNMNVAPSTVNAILKRENLISRKLAQKLTKKHLRRYRRVLPGYLQMDFKYVPYKIGGEQFYQLSCVDHHSSWRLIRIYGEKSLMSVMSFFKLLIKVCPFPILEIQTDNDTAFTDKFSSGIGVTGEHGVDQWCLSQSIRHKLIPVGVKELNGKVENTHKQDDREFYARGPYKDFKNIRLNIKGYNERWNQIRRTKTLGWKSPNEVLVEAYVRSLAWLMWIKGIYPQVGILKPRPKKIRTRKRIGVVKKYLQFLEWESKNKGRAIALLPTMSPNFSGIEDVPLTKST